MLLEAAAATSSTDPLSLLITYGPGGVVALMLATQFLVPKPTYQSALKERDEARAELAKAQASLIAGKEDVVARVDYEATRSELNRLREKLEDKMIPGVFQSTATLERAVAILGRIADRASV